MRTTCPANAILIDLQVMKLLIKQYFPTSRHFLPLRSKYSPQHSVLKLSLCSSLSVRDQGNEILEWVRVAYDRNQCWAIVDTVMNLRVPWKAWNFLTIWVTIIFSS